LPAGCERDCIVKQKEIDCKVEELVNKEDDQQVSTADMEQENLQPVDSTQKRKMLIQFTYQIKEHKR